MIAREADRRAAVVAEDQKARAVRPHLRERHAVEDRAHRVLADAEVEVAAAVVLGLEIAGAVEREPRLRRGREVGRAADQPRNVLGDRVQHLADASRPASPLASAGKSGVAAPSLRAAAAAASARARRPARDTSPCRPRIAPIQSLAQLRAARADARCEVLAHAVGHEELRVLRPAVEALRRADLLFAQRLAVRGVRVLLVRRAVADVAVDDDQRRPAGRLLERRERALEHLQIVGVADARDVPAVADEARGHVLAERERVLPSMVMWLLS